MEPPSNPRRPWYRRLSFRISVRGLIVLVLLVSLALGWWDYLTRQQRTAVRAIEAAGGRVNYQWAFSSVPFNRGHRNWLEKILGADRLCNVTLVAFLHKDSEISKQSIDDALMAKVGNLGHLKPFSSGPGPTTRSRARDSQSSAA